MVQTQVKRCLSLFTVAFVAMVMQGCATGMSPPAAEAESGAAEQEGEVTLTLPEQPALACTPEQVDYTFFDRGVAALAAGDHVEAVSYFQRYQRLESSPAADWESGIAIAYDSLLSSSPFYDPSEARKAFLALDKARPADVALHPDSLLMREALATLVAMQKQIAELESDKALLAEDLEKREVALKRLRELTLGQKAATP